MTGRSTNTWRIAAHTKVDTTVTGAKMCIGSSPCATWAVIRISWNTVTIGFKRYAEYASWENG